MTAQAAKCLATGLGCLALTLSPQLCQAAESPLRFRLDVQPALDVSAGCLIELISALGQATLTPSFELPCGSASDGIRLEQKHYPLTVRLRSADLWAQPFVVHEPATDPVVINAWRLERFDIHFSSVPGQARNADAEVAFEASQSPTVGTQPHGRLACSWLESEPILRCRLPDTRLNLRLSVSGFVPEYLWDIHRNALGEGNPRVLRTGSSLCAWIEAPNNLVQSDSALFLEATPGLSATAIHCPENAEQAASNKRCFLQAYPVTPAQYRIVARAGSRAASLPLDLKVTADPETCSSEVLVLQPLVDARFSIVPSHDANGSNWLARLEGDHHAENGETSDGEIRFTGLSPGAYLLTIRDHEGSISNMRPITISGPGVNELIDLDLVHLSGQVTCRDRPLRGEVSAGFGIPSATGPLDSEGTFSTYLPRPESRGPARPLKLLVRHPESGQQHLGDLEFDRLDERKLSDLALELPDTALGVFVVDTAGRPVPKAIINLFSEERHHLVGSTSTDRKGEAFFECIEPGWLLAFVNAASAESDPTPVQILEGDSIEIKIVVKETVTLRGRVERGAEPVAGARLLVRSLWAEPHPSLWRPISTGADGMFEIKVPVQPVNLVVSASGLPTHFVSVPSPADSKFLVVPVGMEYGSLKLRDMTQPESRTIHHNGVQVELQVLRLEWMSAMGPASLALGNLMNPTIIVEPGEYWICPGVGGRGASDCMPVSVPPWSEVYLE